MNIEFIIFICLVLFVSLIVVFVIYRRIPKKLKVNKYADQWQQIMGYCKDKKKWPHALTEAEKMLKKALKKRKFKGKTMGEMMVSAQKVFTDNDGIWFAHNLYKKVSSGEVKNLKEVDIKEALIAYRQALRDLGALKK